MKCVIEKLEDVPVAWREHYEPAADGRFVLQLINTDAHPAVVTLKADHEREKAERREIKAELAGIRRKLAKLREFDREQWEKFKRDNAALRRDFIETLNAEQDENPAPVEDDEDDG